MTSTTTDRVAGISTSVAVKAPVKCATTANLSLTGLTSVDGIVVVTGDRVLVKDQSNTAENGIYYANTTTWSRCEDFDGTRDGVNGTTVLVFSGTTNGSYWYQVTFATVPPTIGTTTMTWARTFTTSAAPAASETVSGIAELATQAETNTGTDDLRIITPKKLANSTLSSTVSGHTTSIATLTALSDRPTFSAHKNGSAQTSITAATATKLTFTTELWDIDSYYDAANSKFLPLIAGKYLITGAAFFSAAVVDQSQYQLALYKNGSIFQWGNCLSASGTVGIAPAISIIVDMNGTTDYVELWGYGGGSGAKTVSGDPTLTWFQGIRVA